MPPPEAALRSFAWIMQSGSPAFTGSRPSPGRRRPRRGRRCPRPSPGPPRASAASATPRASTSRTKPSEGLGTGLDSAAGRTARLVRHAGIAALRRDHLAELRQRGPGGQAPLELGPRVRGVLGDPAEDEHLLAEGVGDLHQSAGRPLQALDRTRRPRARCRPCARGARPWPSSRPGSACPSPGRDVSATASSRARALSFMNAPRPNLTSRTRTSIPSASFLLRMLAQMRGMLSTVR
jgi:hypothetical protein